MSLSRNQLKIELCEAGAGAGKTTTLVNHVIDLATRFYDQNGRWPRLVLTTFTRKATQELRERIMIKAQNTGRTDLFEYVTQKKDLLISTIHGVNHLFLSRYGSLVGLDPSFTIMEGGDLHDLAKQIVRTRFRQSRPDWSFNMSMNDVTSLLQKFYQWWIVSPDIMPVSEQDLRHAMNDILSIESEDFLKSLQQLDVVSHHGDWSDYFQKSRSMIDQIKNLDAIQKWRLLTELVSLDRPQRYSAKWGIDKDIWDNFREARTALEKTLDPEKWKFDLVPKHAEFLLKMTEFFKAASLDLHKEKIKRGWLVTDDLETLSLHLIQKHPVAAIQFSESWDYWLIDEYQDTSPTQVRLLEKYVGSNSYFVVGDPQQSIYYFRGARSSVFNDRKEAVIKNNGIISFLDTNYRSEPELLSFFNDYFSRFGSGFKKMNPRAPVNHPQYAAAVIGKANSLEEEAQFIALHVQNLIKENVPLEQIAVLVRDRKTMRYIARILSQYKIPYQISAGDDFFSKREVRDVRSLLRFLVNPHDNENLIELMRSPWYFVSDSQIAHWMKERPLSLWIYLQASDSQHASVENLSKALALSRDEGVLRTITSELEKNGFWKTCYMQDSSGQRESNVWKFLRLIEEEMRQPQFHFLDFAELRKSRINPEFADSDEPAVPAFDPNRIVLMTVHASKGLKFDYVFVPSIHKTPQTSQAPDCEYNEWKNTWSASLILNDNEPATVASTCAIKKYQIRKEEVAEHERLFYVALTRAAKRVYLSFQVEKNIKHSWLEKSKWDFTVGTHQCPHYVYEVQEAPFEVSELAQELKNQETVLAPIPSHTITNVASVSVTGLLSTSSTNKQSNNIMSGLKSAIYGTQVHSVFELAHYHGFQLDSVIERQFGSRADQMKRALSWVQNVRELPLKKLIETGKTEWGFAIQIQGYQIDGQIDLWGVVDGIVWLVDYKSGSVEYKDKAFEQLTVYSLALRRQYPNNKMKMAVVYPFGEECYILDVPSEDVAVKSLIP